MRKGQLTIEFLVSVLALIVVLGIFLNSENTSSANIEKHVDSLKLKGELEEIASYCNLLYFNGDSVKLSYSFNLSSFNITNNTITAVGENISAAARCLAEMGKSSKGIEVEGIRKWF